MTSGAIFQQRIQLLFGLDQLQPGGRHRGRRNGAGFAPAHLDGGLIQPEEQIAGWTAWPSATSTSTTRPGISEATETSTPSTVPEVSQGSAGGPGDGRQVDQAADQQATTSTSMGRNAANRTVSHGNLLFQSSRLRKRRAATVISANPKIASATISRPGWPRPSPLSRTERMMIRK